MKAPASYLIKVESDNANPTVEGFIVDGCTFIGSPYRFGQPGGVTEIEIGGNLVTSARITNCHFVHPFNAIVLGEDGPGDSIIVEDCRIDSSTGNGDGG